MKNTRKTPTKKRLFILNKTKRQVNYMQMTIRWFGADKDTVSLEQIRQIPGVTGIVPALHKLPAGEAWPLDMVMDMKKEIEDAGLTMECIESVNVHEDIKLGLPTAEKYIENKEPRTIEGKIIAEADRIILH